MFSEFVEHLLTFEDRGLKKAVKDEQDMKKNFHKYASTLGKFRAFQLLVKLIKTLNSKSTVLGADDEQRFIASC